MTVCRGPFKKCLCRACHPSLYWNWTYSHTITLTACLYFLLSGSYYLCILALSGSQPSILSLSGLLHVYSHSQACCLSILSLSLRLAAYLFSLRQARCLSILTLSGSLPIYSQAHCLCILRLAALGILRLAAYLVSGSLPTYSQAHCLCILRLTAYVF